MNRKLLVIFFFILVIQTHVLTCMRINRIPPLPEHRGQYSFAIIYKNPSLGPNGEKLYGKDILVKGDVKEKTLSDSTHSKNCSVLMKWPNGVIPYVLNENVEYGRFIIETSMKLWSEETCITFRESNTELDDHYIHFKETGTGCNSWVGIYDEAIKEQIVSLDLPCFEIPIVTHELGHAIGLWHEQDRPDKDEYLKIYLRNMKPSDRVYFLPNSSDFVQTYDVPYDYSSVMQYDAFAFSDNGRMTLVPLDPLGEAVMGRATKPSFYDYKLVNIMYNCSDNCENSSIKCFHGGFRTWNEAKGCFCVCPDSYRGRMCEMKLPTKESTCGGRFTTEHHIETPNYPWHHPAKLKCVWWFEAPKDKKVQIHFITFNILFRYEKENHECVWETMRIRSGDIFSDDPGQVYCGKELHDKTLVSKKNNMVLSLTTLTSEYGTGFSADVSFV